MTEQWYFARNGQQVGPVGTAELQRLAVMGELGPDDLVWRQGMHQWAPASTARGVFAAPRLDVAPPPSAPTAASTVGPDADLPGGAALSADAPTAEPPATLRDVRPRPGGHRPRPARKPPGGLTTGGRVALFIGIAAAVLFLAIIVVALLTRQRRGPTQHNRGTYIVNLQQNTSDFRTVRFVAGQPVTITVTSDHNSDVDLHVFDSRGHEVIRDIRPDRDCFVNFVAPRTDWYRIEVTNLGPGFNRCTIRYN